MDKYILSCRAKKPRKKKQTEKQMGLHRMLKCFVSNNLNFFSKTVFYILPKVEKNHTFME